MVRHLRSNSSSADSDNNSCSSRLSSKERLLASVAALMEIASQFTHKLNFNKAHKPSRNKMMSSNKPKQLMSTISRKAVTLLNRKKKINGGERRRKGKGDEEEEEWGDGGVWQRSILMGDKCEPLDFSGAIYYDSKGQQMTGTPLRSPRATPLPRYLQERAQ